VKVGSQLHVPEALLQGTHEEQLGGPQNWSGGYGEKLVATGNRILIPRLSSSQATLYRVYV